MHTFTYKNYGKRINQSIVILNFLCFGKNAEAPDWVLSSKRCREIEIENVGRHGPDRDRSDLWCSYFIFFPWERDMKNDVERPKLSDLL